MLPWHHTWGSGAADRTQPDPRLRLPESAREIELFFNDYELQAWDRSLEPWMVE